MRLFAIAAVLCGGTFLQSTIGFGLGIFAMMFLPHLIPYAAAVPVMQSCAIVNCIYIAFRYRKFINWKTMLPPLVPTLVCIVLFTRLSLSIPVGTLRIALGVVLIIIALYFLIFSDRISIRPTVAAGLIVGTINGTGTAFFGIGGPPAALYFLPAVKDKTTYIATINAYFLFCNAVSIATRIFGGALGREHIPEIAAGWAGVAAGTVAGLLCLKHIKLERLKKMIYGFVVLDGAWIIAQELII